MQVNKKIKAIPPRSENEKGQLKEQEYPLHHSNVQHFSKDKNVRSRVGHKVVEGKKVRYLIKTGELLD
jgi:large subunit ribosomal protein L24